MTNIKSNLEINYVRIILEVASISGLVLGVCWAIAVSKGNELWANKEHTDEHFEKVNDNLHLIEIATSHHITQKDAMESFVTRSEVQDSGKLSRICTSNSCKP